VPIQAKPMDQNDGLAVAMTVIGRGVRHSVPAGGSGRFLHEARQNLVCKSPHAFHDNIVVHARKV